MVPGSGLPNPESRTRYQVLSGTGLSGYSEDGLPLGGIITPAKVLGVVRCLRLFGAWGRYQLVVVTRGYQVNLREKKKKKKRPPNGRQDHPNPMQSGTLEKKKSQLGHI